MPKVRASGAKDVMVDLETLGTHADSVIMSIGACRFDPRTKIVDDDCFYSSISIESNLDAGRIIHESTLLWWLRQPPEAQHVFTEAKGTLEEALVTFSNWFGESTTIWANGTDFDIAMLVHAYAHFKLQPPWEFFNVRDYRTLKNLLIAQRALKPERGVAHNALSDAVYQARHVQAILQSIDL